MFKALGSCIKSIVGAVKKVVFKPAVCGTVAAVVVAPTLVACYGPAPNYGSQVQFPKYMASVCNDGFIRLTEPSYDNASAETGENGADSSNVSKIYVNEFRNTSISCRPEDSSEMMMCRVARTNMAEYVIPPEGCLESASCADSRTCAVNCYSDEQKSECNSNCVVGAANVVAVHWDNNTKSVVQQVCKQDEVCVIHRSTAQCQPIDENGEISQVDTPQTDQTES